MSIASATAVSGMQAASTRLNAAASKIANASAPDAATDLTTEVVNVLTARTTFAANALVLKADARMMQSLLDIKV